MYNNFFKKGLVVLIIILFFIINISSIISGKVDMDNKSSVHLFAFGETSFKEIKKDISSDVAEDILFLFNELKNELVVDPFGEKTEVLRYSFIGLLEDKGLLPLGVSKDEFISLLSPPNVKKPFFDGFFNLIRSVSNPFFNRFLRFFENSFSVDSVVESFDAGATLNFCTIASYGDGYTIPVMIPYRPRIGISWYADFSETYAGEVFSNRAIYAVGGQSGSTVGFTGGGGTFAFPSMKLYVFVGYSWHVTVNAEHIDFYPPNQPPVISDENPIDGAYDVPVSLSELSFRISDPEGESMDFSVTTEPDIGIGSGTNKGNGVYSVPVSGLEYDKMYTWSVELTDGNFVVDKMFNFFTPLKPPFDPFDEGWSYRKRITIDHSLVVSDLVDFPVLISMVDSDLKSKAQVDGDDILFMDGIGVASKLFHEVEMFDGSTGELVVWVRLPCLLSGVDTVFYLYYGNGGCSGQEFPSRVWDSNYVAVHHMSDASKSTIYDSTSYNNDGYKYDTDDPQESDQGKIDRCQQHNSNDNFIRLYDHSSLDIGTGDATMEIWCKTTSNNWESLYYTENVDNNKIEFMKHEDNYDCVSVIFIRGNNQESTVRGSTSLNDGEWHYIAGTIDNSRAGFSDDLRLFVDGDEETISYGLHNWDGTTLSNSNDNWVGKRKNVNKPFQGFLDEFRLSKCERSDAWIKTSYNTMNNPSSFFSVGPEET